MVHHKWEAWHGIKENHRLLSKGEDSGHLLYDLGLVIDSVFSWNGENKYFLFGLWWFNEQMFEKNPEWVNMCVCVYEYKCNVFISFLVLKRAWGDI